MEVIIEIGNEEQKSLIQSELLIIDNILHIINGKDLIKRIIIASNFDEKIRNLTVNNKYESQRTNINHIAMAKTILEKKWGNNSIFSISVYRILRYTG